RTGYSAHLLGSRWRIIILSPSSDESAHRTGGANASAREVVDVPGPWPRTLDSDDLRRGRPLDLHFLRMAHRADTHSGNRLRVVDVVELTEPHRVEVRSDGGRAVASCLNCAFSATGSRDQVRQKVRAHTRSGQEKRRR